MGKASSAKKVARVAKSGGRAKVRTQRGTVFPVALTSVIILGLALVIWARADRRGSTDNAAPTLTDHWHVAYGLYHCDSFLAPLPQIDPDRLGIHTHGDGIVHIHPFTAATAGRNARLGRFFDQENVSMSDTELKLPSSLDLSDELTTWKNGQKCGTSDAILQVAVWEVRTDTSPRVYTKGFKNIRFDKDQMLMTIALAPKGATLPKPESEPTLDNLSDVSATSTTVAGTDTTAAGSGSSVLNADTVAPSTSAGTDTTAATGSTSATTASAAVTTIPTTTSATAAATTAAATTTAATPTTAG